MSNGRGPTKLISPRRMLKSSGQFIEGERTQKTPKGSETLGIRQQASVRAEAACHRAEFVDEGMDVLVNRVFAGEKRMGVPKKMGDIESLSQE